MGYVTVMRVPRIDTYEKALKKYNNVKPIAGRGGDIRPLGERRDVDTYSIRKNVWTEAVELVLYQTPVITFTVEDEVKIKFGTWSSASTCQFISRVLCLSANRVKGQVVLTFSNGEKAMIGDHEELVLVRGNGAWVPKVKQTLYDYRVNRKESNNVRKLVSQFRDYLAGVIKLKTETITQNFGPSFQIHHSVVMATYAELIEVFGAEYADGTGTGRVRPRNNEWVNLDTKPKNYGAHSDSSNWANYREKTNNFFDLVKNDQDDNCRHQNYWIAFNILMAQGQQLYFRDSTDHKVTLGVNEFEKFLDKILMTMFADRVFKRVALAEGKVPTGKYDDYVLTEED